MGTDLATFVAALEETWTSLVSVLEDLTPSQWDLPTDLPGWSVKDNVSHIVGVELLLLGEPFPDHPCPDLPHIRNDAGRWTEVPVDLRRGVPGAAVLAELQDVIERRLKVLRSLEPAALEGMSLGVLGQPMKTRHLLGIRVFDSWAHEQDIRVALGRPGNVAGLAASLSRRRVLLALSQRSPAGSVLVVETTGALPSVATLTLGSSYVDSDADAYDARITTDFETFMRLAMGRVHYPGVTVGIEGDVALAEAFLRDIPVPP